MKKFLVLGIIILFVGAGFIPSTIGIIEDEITFKEVKSFGYIQDLIGNASNGDTIYIPSGTYYENIIINKSISLIGKDKNTTIIDGNGYGTVVSINANWVNISGFTIQNSGLYYWMDTGVHIRSNHTTIIDNIISNNNHGIFLHSSNHNIIKDNLISNNDIGIETYIPNMLFNAKNNTISNNIITSNTYGIYLHGSSNTISVNTIIDNRFGIELQSTDDNIINGNNIISNKEFGIFLLISSNNTIRKNNICFNGHQINFFEEDPANKWIGNYWGRPRFLPKLIFGIIFGLSQFPGGPGLPIPWFNVDWHPAQKPYDI